MRYLPNFSQQIWIDGYEVLARIDADLKLDPVQRVIGGIVSIPEVG
jgi:hypothetical protein